MRIERLCLDPSVSVLFPRAVLTEALGTLPVDIVVLEDPEEELHPHDGVITLEYRDAFLEIEWIHSVQSGVDRFPFDRIETAGTTLTNSAGIHGDTAGETVAGYVLSFSRRLHRYAAAQQSKRWDPPNWDDAWTVQGELACIIGLGTLGRGIIDRLSGLGMRIVGVRRTPLPEPRVERVYTPDALQEAVSDARFVIVAVPLAEDTRDLIDQSVLASMRSDSYLINVSRGDVVDETALIRGLENGDISGAALDVFEEEPLPSSSPLWEMEEVIVTPHRATLTKRYHEHVAAIVRESIQRIRDGDEPVNRVV